MEQEKFKMPTGALVACILITVFLLACVAGGVLFVTDRINNSRNGGGEAMTTDQPAVTNAPVQPTQAPAMPTQPPASSSKKPTTTARLSVVC